MLITSHFSPDDDIRAPIPQQQAILVEDQYHG